VAAYGLVPLSISVRVAVTTSTTSLKVPEGDVKVCHKVEVFMLVSHSPYVNPEVLRRARIDQMLFNLNIMMKYNG